MTDGSTQVTLLSLNLDWKTTSAGCSRQCSAVDDAVVALGGGPAILALQEVKPAAVRRFADEGWSVLAATQAPKGRLGVAVLGRGVAPAGPPLQQEPSWFEVGDVYRELAEWFSERAVAVDVCVGSSTFRFGSFHATPGSSDGPGRQGVGGRQKPWFHRRVADWMATWPRPYGFAIDANSPDLETLTSVKFFIPAGTHCEAGEDHLLGLRSLDEAGPLHDADDLLRVWLRSKHGADRLAELGADSDGPLWISHYTRGGKAKRFDHIWATPEVEPLTVRYWSPSHPPLADAISDHAIVGVRARLAG